MPLRVSILVLMEVTLKESEEEHEEKSELVSILVLMEVTLKGLSAEGGSLHRVFQSLF